MEREPTEASTLGEFTGVTISLQLCWQTFYSVDWTFSKQGNLLMVANGFVWLFDLVYNSQK